MRIVSVSDTLQTDDWPLACGFSISDMEVELRRINATYFYIIIHQLNSLHSQVMCECVMMLRFFFPFRFGYDKEHIAHSNEQETQQQQQHPYSQIIWYNIYNVQCTCIARVHSYKHNTHTHTSDMSTYFIHQIMQCECATFEQWWTLNKCCFDSIYAISILLHSMYRYTSSDREYERCDLPEHRALCLYCTSKNAIRSLPHSLSVSLSHPSQFTSFSFSCSDFRFFHSSLPRPISFHNIFFFSFYIFSLSLFRCVGTVRHNWLW